MRRILLIDGNTITSVKETGFVEEGKLQDYLEVYPNLIPLADIIEGASDLLCIGREVVVSPGAIVDLLCIDQDGLITVIETKLRKNRELRREVIGQIIEYASYISQWNAEDLYQIANSYFLTSTKTPSQYKNKTLDTIMRESFGEQFSESDFRLKIEQNLKKGKMRLIIGVDQLIEPLRSIVSFLNSVSSFDILLLEVSNFEQSDSKKVLIPSLFGYAIKTGGVDRPTYRWDEETFMQNVKERFESKEPLIIDTIQKLYEFTKVNADDITWGRGTTFGSFTFRKSRFESLVTLFAIYSDGKGYISFGELVGKGAKEEYIRKFRDQLNRIPGFNLPENAVSLGKFPTIRVDTLAKEENMKIFKEAVLALCQKIEE